MSRGKYSPFCPPSLEGFVFNCHGQIPSAWNKEVQEAGIPYDEKTMFGHYDKDGFDSYGYSCFDSEGKYQGVGGGVDRLGNEEYDYLVMDDDEFIEISNMQPNPLLLRASKIINLNGGIDAMNLEVQTAKEENRSPRLMSEK